MTRKLWLTDYQIEKTCEAFPTRGDFMDIGCIDQGYIEQPDGSLRAYAVFRTSQERAAFKRWLTGESPNEFNA